MRPHTLFSTLQRKLFTYLKENTKGYSARGLCLQFVFYSVSSEQKRASEHCNWRMMAVSFRLAENVMMSIVTILLVVACL